MKKLLPLLLFFFLLNLSAQNKWQKLNGPSGGTIAALITKGDTIIAGTGWDKALIFYSTNRGVNWLKANFKTANPPHQSRINSFVFTDDGGIIAADAENGIYKSFDLINWNLIYFNGGESWSLGKGINEELYLGMDDGKIFWSTNNGLDWGQMISGAVGRVCNFLLTNDSSLFAGSWMKVLKKNFNSNIWQPIDFQNQNDLYLFADTSNNIYANNNAFIFISSDNGLTWATQDTNHFFWDSFVYGIIYNQRIIGGCGQFDPNPGWGIILSDDKGLTWRYSNNGLSPEITCFRLAKSKRDTYVGTVGAGVFQSTDYGDSWFPRNKGLNASNAVVISFDNDGNLWAACYSNGLYKSTDKGLSWSLKNNGFTNSYIDNIISDSSGILFSSTDRGTYRSTDKGESWNLITSLFFYYMNKDRLNRIYGFSYGSGLYRTTNQGNNWTRLDNGFRNGYVFGFAIDSSNNIYVGTYEGAIYKSTDDGITWTNVYQSSIQGSEVNKITIAPNGTIFATNWSEGILRSTDKGITWTLQKSDNYNPQYYPINVNKKGVVFASGSNSTFFSSTDNGETWNDITDNLAMTTVQDIIFDKNDTMYLATDESVWRSNPDTTVGIRDKSPIILQYTLSQNYPNPFNPISTINYSIKDAGLVRIDVYDILGRKVETLVNEEKQSGNYSVTFNAKSITSGVYFYKLEINNYVSVKKMIFMK